VALAVKSRLPSRFPFSAYVEEEGRRRRPGAGVPPNRGVRRQEQFVDKILKDARPGDLPIEQPARIDPVINRKTAALPRVAIPPLLLPRAQPAIE
jgi:putative tryptophan/tyrosine transport system substrate-binding protein